VAGKPPIVECTFDPWRTGQIGHELEQRGIRVSAFPQHDARMIPASQRLYDAIVEHRLVHPDDPRLNAHIAAAVARHGRRGWRIDKANRSDKIDAAVPWQWPSTDRESTRAREADRVALARPCPGCGRLTSTGSRCQRCQPRRPRGRREKAMRRQVFARYGRTCVHCGAVATDVDHLIPIAAGGTDELSNLRPPCAACDRGRL
jgi:HNH endonuclease